MIGSSRPTVIGNLTSTAKQDEYTDKKSGKKYTRTKFGIAVNYGKNDDQVNFYSASLIGDIPQPLLDKLKSGASVACLGDLTVTNKQDWDGQGAAFWLNLTIANWRHITVWPKEGIGTSPVVQDGDATRVGGPAGGPAAKDPDEFDVF